jgi:hypothetical protein
MFDDWEIHTLCDRFQEQEISGYSDFIFINYDINSAVSMIFSLYMELVQRSYPQTNLT